MSNLLEGLHGGLTLLVVGPPGSGKSTLLGSVGELTQKVALLLPKPNEAESFLYRRYGWTPEIFRDHRWNPALEMYEADGYLRLMRRIYALYEDTETDVVILDPMTDAVALAAHDLMKGEKAATPRDLRDSIGFYGSLKYKLKDLVQSLVGLSSADLPKPKTVLVSIHAQPTKEEDLKGKEGADSKGKGVEFFGDVLPMMEGGYRRELASEFGIVCYSSVRHQMVRAGGKMERKTEYVVQMVPDSERHAKVRLSPALAEKEFPNNLKTILEAVREAREAA